jgi:hypothetical protein
VKAYAVDRVEELLNVTATAWDLLYERGEAIILSDGAMENRKEWRPQLVFVEFDPSRYWRRCCKTIRGHIALVSLGAQPGDIIFVILAPDCLSSFEVPLNRTSQPHWRRVD